MKPESYYDRRARKNDEMIPMMYWLFRAIVVGSLIYGAWLWIFG